MMKHPKLKKLEECEIWLKADSIVKDISALYHSLPEDDRINLKFSLYLRSFDLANDVAQACGTILPKDIEQNISFARRTLFGLRSAYKHLAQEGVIELEPEFMVKLNELNQLIDDEIKRAWQELDELEEAGKTR